MQASFAIGGERAAAVLPLMLKPGAMGKMPAEQRAKLRQVTGVAAALRRAIVPGLADDQCLFGPRP